MPENKSHLTPAGQTASDTSDRPSACLVLADGSIFHGVGYGASGEVAGTLIFNTAMSGYQEVMTDPASTGQIICFTFPHIGATGVTPEDNQSAAPSAAAIITRSLPDPASNWRATENLVEWMADHGVIGIGRIDTRRLTLAIRRSGTLKAVLAHDPDGKFDIDAMMARAKGEAEPAMLAGPRPDGWTEGPWQWPGGFAGPAQNGPGLALRLVVLDHGASRDALRQLAETGAEIIILPGDSDLQAVLDQNPNGIFLSHGPGDPRKIPDHVLSVIRGLMARDLPIHGTGLGHQLLALALGAKVVPLLHGHHGANHPVRPVSGGQVEISSMNYGFAVDGDSLPTDVIATHESLFDGSNCGLRVEGRAISSTQHQPGLDIDAADPLARFIAAMRDREIT